jgi:pimeloyl-ACP methyl ester carboxylesterase
VDTPDIDDGPRARFARAYADAVARWPVPVTAQTAATEFGATHVLACGAGPAVVLLPGGGATAVAWAGLAAELSRGHRVVAVDPVGQPGLSTTGERPVRTAWDLAAWLDQVRLRAVPLAVRPSTARVREFLARETRGRSLDPAWLAVTSAGADLGRPKIVLRRCPRPAELAGHIQGFLV